MLFATLSAFLVAAVTLGAEYEPTPQSVVEAMLDLAAVRPDDVVYDLGCGDGRIVIAAAKRGARGVDNRSRRRHGGDDLSLAGVDQLAAPEAGEAEARLAHRRALVSARRLEARPGGEDPRPVGPGANALPLAALAGDRVD